MLRKPWISELPKVESVEEGERGQQGDRQRNEGSQQAHHTGIFCITLVLQRTLLLHQRSGPQKGELEESSQRIQVTRLHSSGLYGRLDKQNKTSKSST